jgi:dethiobiotin synthetase
VSGRLVVISGTGTNIGKTHFAEALLGALATTVARTAGIKPIESGVTDPTCSDAARLERASTFHVKRFGYALRTGLSPHIAARMEGVNLDLAEVVHGVGVLREDCDVLVLELPGGLFTPLSERAMNADLAREMRPDETLLVVPNRLGALHDAIAAVRAAGTASLQVHGIVLVTPEAPDASTGSNAQELRALLSVPFVVEVGQGSVETLAATGPVMALARRLVHRGEDAVRPLLSS